MGFVYGDVGNAEPCLELIEQAQKIRVEESFWSDVEQFDVATQELGLAIAGFCHAQAAVEVGGGDLVDLECRDLILHQRNEGGHHNHDPRFQQGGELKTNGFSAAGGHDDEEVLPCKGCVDDVALAWAKGVVAEVVLEGGFKGGGLGSGDCWLGGHPSVVLRTFALHPSWQGMGFKAIKQLLEASR